MPLSAAERQRRSDLARQMHAEGRLGSRAVAKKAAARSAELRTMRADERASRIAQGIFERHRDAVEKALVDGLKNGSPATRVRAAETLVKLALRGESLDTTAAKAKHEAASREELLDLLADKLNNSMSGSLIRARMGELNGGEIIDAEAVELSS